MASKTYEDWQIEIIKEEEKSLYKALLINQVKHLRQFNLTRKNPEKVVKLRDIIELIERGA